MTTQISGNLVSDWGDLNTDPNVTLVDGVEYSMQNVGVDDLVLYEAAAAPTPLDGTVVEPRGWVFVTKVVGQKIFIRSTGGSGQIAVND